MKYCTNCLMPDTRPGIVFYKDGVCAPCKNYEKQKEVDWNKRKIELDILCDKYRGKYGNSYDCAIAVSGGKDSHFQVYYMKEIMGMNPVLLSTSNLEWTETGRQNILNISDAFGCDIISMNSNVDLARKLIKKALVKNGSPTWYIDALIYAFPYRMAMQLGLHLLVYGEDINYTYGGKYNDETPFAKLQSYNDVVKPMADEWLKDGDVTAKELNSAIHPSLEECEKSKLESIYLSYFVKWNSYYNYQVAHRYGFKHLYHEHRREGTIEQYDQVDSLGYLVHAWFKYPKYGHASSTDVGSKLIRYGLATRNEMIPLVETHDGVLDQEILGIFCDFIQIKIRDFWDIADTWYNTKLFKRDEHSIWTPKFKVGVGLIE